MSDKWASSGIRQVLIPVSLMSCEERADEETVIHRGEFADTDAHSEPMSGNAGREQSMVSTNEGSAPQVKKQKL